MTWWKSMQFDPKLAQKVKAILQSHVVKPDTQKIGAAGVSLAYDIPWVFVKPAYQPHCHIWNAIYFQTYGLIPQFCREHCHKVVAKPRTVHELFRMWDLMEALDFPGKLGLDKRDYTFGPYAAFFYCVSMREGQQRYKQVRQAVDAAFPNPQTFSVILKKGCTEMEHKLFEKSKPSNKWGKATPQQVEREMLLDDMHEKNEAQAIQPEWLKNLIAYHWIAAAHAIGDPSYYDLVTELGIGDILGDPPVTYHPKGKEVSKRPRPKKVRKGEFNSATPKRKKKEAK